MWNKDKCRCECKELIDKGICDTGFIWNPSNYNCECVKSSDVGEYLDYKYYKRRKKLLDKLVKECSEKIDGNEMIYNYYENVYDSCAIYIVLLVTAFLIIIGINSAYFYFFWLKKR